MTAAPEKYDFYALERKWQKRWEQQAVFRVPDKSDKPKYYALEMFPYPSGSGLHVGHCKNFLPTDAFVRYKRMMGFNVLYPMGWDAFGQPAENEAIKRKRNPKEMVAEYSSNYRRTLKLIGSSYDWEREINSSASEYYKWTQYCFLLLYKRGLAYRADAPINWCPSCKTGLANEEVQEKRCWRCGTLVEKRPMPQWYFKITAYADRLLKDLDLLDWSDGLKAMQREWIGRSEGASISFEVAGHPEKFEVFTTRPDTIFGATFMVLAPEHPLVEKITSSDKKSEVESYLRKSQMTLEIERASAEREKTGVFIGAHAINPATGKKIPIWIADYVLMGYGTGAIMAVPAHDQRDFEFAKKFSLDIRMVYRSLDGPQSEGEMREASPHGGKVINSGEFDGLEASPETVSKFISWLEKRALGKSQVTYKLRDWLISRQRYWGAPIPIIHCASCGEVPVPEADLPVLLPEVENYEPSGTGESPLAKIDAYVNATCPRCKAAARRETDTMGGYVCSSWYFLRYVDANNQNAFAAREKLDYWLPVDTYTGGVEHACSHLLYSRFFVKVMFDAGLLGFQEPFLTLRNQGSLLAFTPGRKPKSEETSEKEGETESIIDWIVLKPEERDKYPADQVVWRWARMSKSKGNVVTPEEVVEKYGADSLRVYIMFVVPFEENVQWTEEGIQGAARFVGRVWRWTSAATSKFDPNWRTQLSSLEAPAERDLRRKLHQTIRKVGEDIEKFRFNTAVAALMEFTNEVYAYCQIDDQSQRPAALISEILENLILIMAPFTPHLSEEIWERLGHSESISQAQFPQFDPQIAADQEITLVVQINGKVRDRIQVPAQLSDEQAKEFAMQSEKIAKILEGKQVQKIITVPRKLVNIVI